MDVNVRGLPESTPYGTAVALGVFDGAHLGHQRILRELTDTAARENLTPEVVTLSTHPDHVLSPDKPRVFLLTSLSHRIALLKKYGAKRVHVIEFDTQLASMTAREFLETLKTRLDCRHLIAGEDAKIGRSGTLITDFEFKESDLGMKIATVPLKDINGQRISSTVIRNLIYKTQLDGAAKMLGRRFSSYGKVIPGRHRGHELGFPTLNIDVEREVRPPLGVYAGWVVIEDMGIFNAVTNIGVRPTFEGPHADPLIETHVIHKDIPDIYGRHVEFIYYRKVRDERLFYSPEALKEQITEDVVSAIKLLNGADKPCDTDYVLHF